jgi:hypothetical protein
VPAKAANWTPTAEEAAMKTTTTIRAAVGVRIDPNG